MKILHIIGAFSNFGGVYEFHRKLKNGLSKYHVDNYYLGVKSYIDINDIESNSRILSDPSEIISYINELNPDIVHFHDGASNYIGEGDRIIDLISKGIKNRIKLRTIHSPNESICPKVSTTYIESCGDCNKSLTYQCVTERKISDDMYHLFNEYLESLKEYDLITYFADYISENLLKIGIEKSKLRKIPPLISKSEVISMYKDNTILFVGRIVQWKGIRYLLKALSNLNTKDWKLIIAGKGDKDEIKYVMREARDLSILNRIEFTGYIEQEKLANVYNRSKLMILPSIGHEGYCFAGAGAISHGVPVIAFDVKGIEEWLTHQFNGLIVPVKDIDALANAIDEVLSDQDLYSHLRRNCCEWNNSLCIEEQIADIYNCYINLLS